MDIFAQLSTGSAPSLILIFLAGLLSFFSPCIIPILPLYMGYLAGGTKQTHEDGSVTYERKTVLIHTIFFVIGISAAFFVLAFALSFIGTLLNPYKGLFVKASAILIIVFGVFMLFGSSMGSEKRFSMPAFKKMNPLVAFLMGFLFSFAWTPCVGPILASVLLLVSNSSNVLAGLGLMAIYTAGFIVPFILLGLFTSEVLRWLSSHRNILMVTVRVAAVVLIVLGISVFTGWINSAGSLFSSATTSSQAASSAPSDTSAQKDAGSASATTDKGASDKGASGSGAQASTSKKNNDHPAPDFELVDQNGKTHKLSDYRGKTVFVNFWATWCPPCMHELPDVQKLYEAHGKNANDVVVLGIANPTEPNGPRQNDKSPAEITAFLKAHQIDFPVLMDTTGQAYSLYAISSLPTTFIVDPDGNIARYVPGAISYDVMEKTVAEAAGK